MKNNILLFLCAGVILLPTSSVFAETAETQGYEIMSQVYSSRDNFTTRKASIRLIIQNKEGDERIRYFDNLRKHNSNEKRNLMRFYRPQNVKGTTLLNINTQEGTKQWIYFPALRKVKVIDSKERKKSFMGSDFTYDDISDRSIDQDQHRLIKSDDDFHYIRSIPKSSESNYSSLDIVIEKKLMVIRQIQFYDKRQEKLKTLSTHDIKVEDTIPTAYKAIMKNHQTGGSSTLIVEKNEYNLEIANIDVGLRGLRDK